MSVERAADEQDSRQRDRSGRRRAQRFGVDPLRLYPDQGSHLRRRRRLLVGAARRSATTSTWRTTSATSSAASPRWPRSIAAGVSRRPRLPAVSPPWRRRALEDYRDAMDRFALEGGAAAAFRIVDAANEYIAETEPWALARRRARTPRRLSQVLFDVAEALRVAGDPAAADHPEVGRGDPAPRRRDHARRSHPPGCRRLAQRRRAHDRQRRQPVAPH